MGSKLDPYAQVIAAGEVPLERIAEQAGVKLDTVKRYRAKLLAGEDVSTVEDEPSESQPAAPSPPLMQAGPGPVASAQGGQPQLGTSLGDQLTQALVAPIEEVPEHPRVSHADQVRLQDLLKGIRKQREAGKVPEIRVTEMFQGVVQTLYGPRQIIIPRGICRENRARAVIDWAQQLGSLHAIEVFNRR